MNRPLFVVTTLFVFVGWPTAPTDATDRPLALTRQLLNRTLEVHSAGGLPLVIVSAGALLDLRPEQRTRLIAFARGEDPRLKRQLAQLPLAEYRPDGHATLLAVGRRSAALHRRWLAFAKSRQLPNSPPLQLRRGSRSFLHDLLRRHAQIRLCLPQRLVGNANWQPLLRQLALPATAFSIGSGSAPLSCVTSLLTAAKRVGQTVVAVFVGDGRVAAALRRRHRLLTVAVVTPTRWYVSPASLGVRWIPHFSSEH